MDIQTLKTYILENALIPVILQELNCHHIKDKGDYITCGNPDGDNQSAITVYKNEYLTAINYTRDITQGKQYGTDIFSLVEFFKSCDFFRAVKLVCDWINLDYYHDFDEDMPESIRLTKLILEMQRGEINQDCDKALKPISEKILTYYKPYVNDMFLRDGISYETQRLFEVGYCDATNRITIPIRDEIGNLVGVKGRLFQEQITAEEMKYIYLEPCSRSKILYGINLTLPYIKQKNMCMVAESEKAVQQLWTMGYRNSCGIGGKKISSQQIDKLTRLCVDLMFLFDKDVTKSELEEIAERFIENMTIYAVIDRKNILSEKESPTDDYGKFKLLLKQCVIKLK